MTVDHDPSAARPPKKPSASAMDDWAVVGEIVGTFGIHGELKVRPLTDFPERFAPGSAIYLGEGHERRLITSSRAQGAQLVIGLEGCESATDAERLRGKTLAVPAQELTALSGDQFYQHDIIGLRVERMDGSPLGVITSIIPSGASDLYVVRDPATEREHLLPAVKEFIREVDVAAGVMRVEPIPGLFDEDVDEAR